ncbi:hypothetical protein [Aureimonas glaciei]|uniref:Uncharacterized protein n=1 Tax=Aureimonas glaciei TaxID=1776957 RepID=A0A916YG22_9HYPH|nr:hypothetical protein [Aureimonas glaciei]GGD43103.1 hypothetical protein GCM10011335_52200 [Aureimonas glaciei]
MPTPRELTARAAALVEELSRISDELYSVDRAFSDALDGDEIGELKLITPALASRIRSLNDGPARRDDRAEEAGHRAYQLAHEAA